MYLELWAVAENSLRAAHAGEDTGSQYLHRLSAIMFAALAFEAWLNHVGEERLNTTWADGGVDRITMCWKDIERKLGPSEKLALLSHVLDVEYDQSRAPWQRTLELIRLRNQLAHGRTVYRAFENEPVAFTDGGIPDIRSAFPTKWEEAARDAERYLKDVESAIRVFHAAVFDEDAFVLCSGTYASWVEPCPST